MNVKIKKLSPTATVPTYGTAGAACFDLYADTVSGMKSLGDFVFFNGDIVCGTGLSFEVPEGHAMLVFSRSGHGFKNGVRLANCVGVIDSDYRGEVAVKLTANGQYSGLNVTQGARVAQAMIIPVDKVAFELVDDLSNTDRQAAGFGSTGA